MSNQRPGHPPPKQPLRPNNQPAYARIREQVLSASQRMRAIRVPIRRIPPPAPNQKRPLLPPARFRKSLSKIKRRWVVITFTGFFAALLFLCGFLVLGLGMIYNSGILSGVTVAGIELSGLSEAEATTFLESQWSTITLRDGNREWYLERQSLGIVLDAAATAKLAFEQGRTESNLLEAMTGVEVAPIVTIDSDTMVDGLFTHAALINYNPINSGIEVVNGRAQATAPVDGRMLDVAATVEQAQANPVQALSNGVLDLVMVPIAPTITDAGPVVEAANTLLTYPLTVRAHDPMTGDVAEWPLGPEAWGNWLMAVLDADSASGLSLAVRDDSVRSFLEVQSGVFDATRYLDIDEATGQIKNAIMAGDMRPNIRVYHHDRIHTVRAGESITSIAWDYGVPYPWVQAANPGVTALDAGQSLTIPSIDNFMDFSPVPDKRIVVSISRQRAWIYENGAVKWEWPISTGINDSPTWTGIYQILSHERNAYAGNWNLHMPHFMGVYRPIPEYSFTNGFHGFPTRGGGQLLWENSLGTRVTYGCILLSNTNAQLLYNWAENGVVVEIQG